MYFIEHFLDMAQRDGHSDYIRMMQRDIIRVVDAVAPDDGSGAANVKVVRKVSCYPKLCFSIPRPVPKDVIANFNRRFYKAYRAKGISMYRP